MADLKKLYEDMDLKNVMTYIQSGNVVFSAGEDKSAPDLVGKIENKIKEKYGFEVPMVIRTLEQWQQIISINPFLKRKNPDTEKCFLTVLSDSPGKSEIESISNFICEPDEFVIIDQNVFLYIPGKYQDTRLSNDFFEKKLHVKASCRNWKTVVALAGLSIQSSGM